MKTCSRCKKEKSLDRFYANRQARDGKCAACKECMSEYNRARWSAMTPDRRRRNKLSLRYGLTVEQYEEMLTAQDGVCAICGSLPLPGVSLCVDHDHRCCPGEKTCGRCLRKLLCTPCNLVIGYAYESVSILRSAADYVEEVNS